MTPERARELLDAEELRLRQLRETEQARVEESLENSREELASVDQHPGDAGTETHDRERDETIIRSLEAELAEIADARRRLDEGFFGVCVECEEQIPSERLEAQPATRHCVEHQREFERHT